MNENAMKQTLKEFAVGVTFGAAFSLLACTVASARTVVAPDSLMINVPNFGPSRYETVAMCLSDAGVTQYQNLMTDTEVETFDRCMVENT